MELLHRHLRTVNSCVVYPREEEYCGAFLTVLQFQKGCLALGSSFQVLGIEATTVLAYRFLELCLVVVGALILGMVALRLLKSLPLLTQDIL